jgi:ubiquinone/menaquinone biosynthesis C-methylase UbiE
MAENVSQHYAGGDESSVVDRVRSALDALDPGPIAPEQLAAMDHFHVRGAQATAELAELVGVQAGWSVLDAGSGLGGPSRHLAARYGCHVDGVDLTPAFVELAGLLAARSGLAERVRYTVGDVTALPFDAASFDLVWCEHVAMNIADRDAVYREFRRVLKRGGRLAFYDVVAVDGAEAPQYPMPWSEAPATSFLRTAPATVDAIGAAGFVIEAQRDATQDALAWFQQTKSVAPQGPTLGLVMGPRMATMAANLARSLRAGRLALLMGIARAI